MKRITALLLALLLCITTAFPAFADATPSNARASAFAVMPLAVDMPYLTFSNYDVVLGMVYYDMVNATKMTFTVPNPDGSFSFERPADFVSAYRLITLYRSDRLFSLASAYFGADINTTFYMDLSHSSHFGGHTWGSFYPNYTNDYLVSVNAYNPHSTVTNDLAGGFFKHNFEISGNRLNQYVWHGGAAVSTPVTVPYGGWINLDLWIVIDGQIVKLGVFEDSEVPTDPTDPTLPTDPVDPNLPNPYPTPGTDDSEVVYWLRYISAQISAFWDQLAGAFTSQFSWLSAIYDKMGSDGGDNSTAIVDSIDRQTDDLINNANDNAEDIIDEIGDVGADITNNIDANTDKILNGYESDTMDDANDRLQDSLTEYEQVETDLFDSLSDYIGDMEYNLEYPSGVLASMIFFGGYIQRIFDNLGSFNLPITVSLLLTFILMLIGFFRYKL